MGYHRVGASEALDFRRRYDGGESIGQLAAAFGRATKTVWESLLKSGKVRDWRTGWQKAKVEGRLSPPPPRQRTRFLKEDFFRTLKPSSAWVLGLIYGDGNVATGKPRLRIAFGVDQDIACKVAALLEYTGPLDFRSNCWFLEAWSQPLVNDLRLLGIFPAKTYTMSFPTLPEDVLPYFVRGLWESDGSVCFTHPTGKSERFMASYSSASQGFVASLRDAITSATGCHHPAICARWSKKSATPTHAIGYSGTQARKLCAWMYGSSTEATRSNRKFALVEKALSE